jgi:uncharacterized membrane protein
VFALHYFAHGVVAIFDVRGFKTILVYVDNILLDTFFYIVID